jgi:alpha-L-fucosidase
MARFGFIILAVQLSSWSPIMTRFPKKLLTKWFAEALAIALGIFLGISAESWWQERIEIQEETQYLAALHEDFIQSIVLLDEIEERQERQVLYLENLLQGGANQTGSEDVREWLDYGMNMILTYRPQFSAFDDLEISGQMQLLRDQQLRRELAVLKQTITSLQSTQLDFIDSQQNLIDPYLVDELDLAWVFNDSESPEVSADSKLYLSAIETREFRSRAAFKLNLRGLVNAEQRAVREQLEHVIELIEAQLQ